MSHKEAKKNRKDIDIRREGFQKEIVALGEKYKLDIRAVLNFQNPSAIQATLILVDMKDIPQPDTIKPAN